MKPYSHRENSYVLLIIGAICAAISVAYVLPSRIDAAPRPALTDGPRVENVRETLLTISSRHPAVRRQAGLLAARISRAKYARYFYPDPKLGVVYSNLPSGRFVYNRTPMTGIELQLRQPLPFPGRLSLKARIADDRAETARLDLARAKNALARRFLSTAIDRARLARLETLTRTYGRQIRIVSETARTRYAVGRGNLSDLSRANLMHSKYQERAAKYSGRLKGSEHRLKYFLEEDSDDTENAKSSESSESPNETRTRTLPAPDAVDLRAYTRLLDSLLAGERNGPSERSLDVARARIMTRTGQSRASLAKLDYLPDFELFAAYRQRDVVANDPVSGEDFASFGLSMRLPLWSAFNNHHQVRAEDRARESRKFAERDVERAVIATAADLQARRKSLTERIRLYKTRLLPQARRARSSAQLAYQTGGVDFDTLLASWDTLYTQKAELIELEARRDRAVVDLATLYNLVLPESDPPAEKKTETKESDTRPDAVEAGAEEQS